MIKEDIQKEIESKISKQKKLEIELSKLEAELATNTQFKKFIDKQKELKEANAQSDLFFEELKEKMEATSTKSIKGDWGSITLAERIGWDIDEEELPKKFFKKVVDTKKITDTYRLEGKAPKGASKIITRYITKRFK